MTERKSCRASDLKGSSQHVEKTPEFYVPVLFIYHVTRVAHGQYGESVFP